MIFAQPEELRARAERVAARLSELKPVIRESGSPIGGGSTPDQMLPTWIVELGLANTVDSEQKLRQAEVPVIARIERDKIILDMRTVADSEEDALVDAVRRSVV
jgi:L-seryl-tRNA(Ser) seleniumtransferase